MEGSKFLIAFRATGRMGGGTCGDAQLWTEFIKGHMDVEAGYTIDVQLNSGKVECTIDDVSGDAHFVWTDRSALAKFNCSDGGFNFDGHQREIIQALGRDGESEADALSRLKEAVATSRRAIGVGLSAISTITKLLAMSSSSTSAKQFQVLSSRQRERPEFRSQRPIAQQIPPLATTRPSAKRSTEPGNSIPGGWNTISPRGNCRASRTLRWYLI